MSQFHPCQGCEVNHALGPVRAAKKCDKPGSIQIEQFFRHDLVEEGQAAESLLNGMAMSEIMQSCFIKTSGPNQLKGIVIRLTSQTIHFLHNFMEVSQFRPVAYPLILDRIISPLRFSQKPLNSSQFDQTGLVWNDLTSRYEKMGI